MNEMQYLELHGDRVAYQDVGHGEALLLIHGMAGSSNTWRAVLPQLSKKYRVIAPDLLGHGDSAKPRADYSLGAFAVWLRDLLDELGVTRATVIGQSLGVILPPSFRDSHHAGFARFQLTQTSKVLNHPLRLATFCADGHAIESEHFIVAEKNEDGNWSFAATLRPLTDEL